MVLIDLPGYTTVGPPGEETLPQQIREINEPYLADEDNILVVVNDAATDKATSVGLSNARKHDPTRSRTLGVATKMDKATDPEDLAELAKLLQNDPGNSRSAVAVLDRHGWVGVRCRKEEEQQKEVSCLSL